MKEYIVEIKIPFVIGTSKVQVLAEDEDTAFTMAAQFVSTAKFYNIEKIGVTELKSSTGGE